MGIDSFEFTVSEIIDHSKSDKQRGASDILKLYHDLESNLRRIKRKQKSSKLKASLNTLETTSSLSALFPLLESVVQHTFVFDHQKFSYLGQKHILRTVRIRLVAHCKSLEKYILISGDFALNMKSSPFDEFNSYSNFDHVTLKQAVFP